MFALSNICMYRNSKSSIVFFILLAGSAAAPAQDWPQFRGPHGAGIAGESGLTRNWTNDGPTELWRRPLGEGFASLTVVEDQLYTLFAENDDEYVAGFRVADGTEVWRRWVGEKFVDHWGNGPRATPAVDGDVVYALASNGALIALRAGDGHTLWEVDLAARLGSPAPNAGAAPGKGPLSPYWGFCSSPLVEGDLVIVYTGSGGGNSLVALDKRTGETRWGALDHASSYSSPTAVTLGGRRQIVVAMAGEIVSLSTAGELLWRHPWGRFNVSQPVFVAPDKLFFSAPNDVGAVLLKVDGKTVEEVWREPRMRNNWQSSVFYRDSIIGFDNATLKALSAESADVLWAERGLGKGTLVVADDLFFILSDRGVLTLAEWRPEGFRLAGQRTIFDGTTMTAPSVARGKLFLRNHKEMVCLDLKSKTPATAGGGKAR